LIVHASVDSGVQPAISPRAAPQGRWPGLICRLPKPLLVVPMVAYWLWLALRYRSLSLPSAADPSIAVGGLVGESKIAYFEQVEAGLGRWLAPTAAIVKGASARDDARAALRRLGLSFPVIAKPDIGWCGFGVRRIDDEAALDAYIDAYPAGETLLLQEYLDLPGEAGVFYVRWPEQPSGRVVSLTVRHPPHVVGDGSSSLRDLIGRDDALSLRMALYRDLERVPERGQVVPLSTVWSFRMGGCYRASGAAAPAALEAALDAIASSMPNLHVARFDIRFASESALSRGDFKIIEINGAGSEAIEFFDSGVPFFTAYRGILAKQAMVFAIAARNRDRGFAPCGWRALLAAFRRQARLIALYPESN
jgi:hypothetical protein